MLGLGLPLVLASTARWEVMGQMDGDFICTRYDTFILLSLKLIDLNAPNHVKRCKLSRYMLC